MARYKVWDPFIRLFHWSMVLLFAANSFFTDPEGTLHAQIGYALTALIALRLAWGFIGPLHARFSSFLPSLRGVTEQLSDIALCRHIAHQGHSPLGALMVFNLLFSLLAIGATGYLTTVPVGAAWAEDLHEALVAWAEFCVVLHIAAVLFESRRIGVNLIGAMINGVKHIPQHRDRE